jgi:RNA polymerase sigma-70 factor (ECF subfamily)
MEDLSMVTINLRDFYPWYTHDEFADVPDAVAAELLADRRYHKAHERRVKRNKAQYSLDAEDGIETAAVTHSVNSPEAVLELMERHCALCRALNSLPDKQGRRIEAHYLIGQSQKAIAEAEGVAENSVSLSIKRGLRAMEKFLRKFD